jgi:uncharacterized protein (DUF427 family)
VRVEIDGEVVAESTNALRVLETSHPPVIYIPPGDIVEGWLIPSRKRTTWCEFKGRAHYFYAATRSDERPVAWTYRSPSKGYEALKDYVAFYPGRVDAAYLDDERVPGSPATCRARSRAPPARWVGSSGDLIHRPVAPHGLANRA